MVSKKPVDNAGDSNTGETTRFNLDFVSRAVQTIILVAIVLMLLLSPVVVYWFTARFESTLPMCTNEQPASDTWRCKVQEGEKIVITGGNPEYCFDGKQHFVTRGWCNFNWDRPLDSAQAGQGR